MNLINALKDKYATIKQRKQSRECFNAQLKLTQVLSGLAMINTCLGSQVEQYENCLVFSNHRSDCRCVVDFDNSAEFTQQVADFSAWTIDLFDMRQTDFERREYALDFLLNKDKLNAILNIFYDQYLNDKLTRNLFDHKDWGFFHKAFNTPEVVYEGDTPQKLTMFSAFRRVGVVFGDLEKNGFSRLSVKEFNRCIENELLRQAERVFAPADYHNRWGGYDDIDFSKVSADHSKPSDNNSTRS